jgi:hypothetical protein
MENTRPITDSFALTSRFSNGQKRGIDELIPVPFRRVRQLHLKSWRTTKLDSVITWGVEGYSVQMPESSKVISSAFLRIDLPAISASGVTYKKNPGLKCIKSMRILVAGSEAYNVPNYQIVLRDYMESLQHDHEWTCFAKAHFGYEAVLTNAARKVHIPILLPNSPYLTRNSSSAERYGTGVWPNNLSGNRIEVQFTMYANTYQTSNRSATPSIQNACSLAIREIKMSSTSLEDKYGSAQGTYSIVTREFQELTVGYQAVSSGADASFKFANPTGSVSELQVFVIPAESNDEDRDIFEGTVLPAQLHLDFDGIRVKSFDFQEKLLLENYSQGIKVNSHSSELARVYFTSHAAESTALYNGSMRFDNVSQLTLSLTAPAQNVLVRVYAVKYASVQIDSQGQMRSYLE